MQTDALPIGPVVAPFDPVKLAAAAGRARRRAALTLARPFLSWLFDVPEYSRLYEQAQTLRGPFCARALGALDVTVTLAAGSESGVPSSGPLIVVANHPHGMLDGLALVDVVARRRSDVRVLTNHLLAPLPELAEMCLFVNAFEHRGAARTRTGLREALRWLRQDHALIVFPAGAVAHADWQLAATPSDTRWHDTVGRLAALSGAHIVPAHIAGRNSDVFYRAGRIHAALRTLLLPRELLAKQGQAVSVRLGRPLKPARHDARVRNGRDVTALLRAEVERLGERAALPQDRRQAVDMTAGNDVGPEVNRLGDEHRLLQSGRFDVYCAPAARIPAALREIGRLREIAFRSVGEGTGRAIDLDGFDRDYLHLFVWDREAGLIAGAYRVGAVDRIVSARGLEGLYTSTLFRYDARLLEKLGPAVELGRSFVRAEYQRSSNTLMLLWKGIAQFMLRSRDYRVLFGPVSVSARYSDMSRRLLQAFLLQNARHGELAELVEAVAAPGDSLAGMQPGGDVQALDALISGLEPDRKGIPVLLRQYLRLNAKLLAFNVDHAFGDALDALMMVDLADVDRAILMRYFGHEGVRRFKPAPACAA